MTPITLLDTPMLCCGMMQGHGFSSDALSGKRYSTLFRREVSTYRPSTKDDYKQRLQYLIDQSGKYHRNCAMIVLSEAQGLVKEVAEELGFKTIQTFFNPNSNNLCYIMTYLHFDGSNEYLDEWEDDEEGDD